MSFRRINSLLLACCGGAAFLAATVEANAGGFALREQSTYGQGSSFAGVAAGGSLSSMYWNPATMTQMPGIQTEVSASAILPYASHTPTTGSTLAAFGGTNDTADDALVPSGYASWQINPNAWIGISVNSPFGLSVSFPNVWAGRDYAANSSSLKTYNATPTFAYRINDWISVGFGVQVQYAKSSLGQGFTFPGPTLLNKNLSGDGWGYGFTAGVTLTPTPTTTIGLGYRSAINQKIEGQASVTLIVPPTNVNTTIKLPDTLSLGLRQQVGPQWTLLGTVEWTNWSRIGTSNVNVSSTGAFLEALPFQFKDGWFFSLGTEYQASDRLTLRAGIGYEKSPVTDLVRIPLLPDNDRTWASVGASYHISKDLVFDLAYSHLWVKDTHIDISAASGNPWFNPAVPISYIGNVSSHVDILSMALKYRWDDAAPAPKKLLVTK